MRRGEGKKKSKVEKEGGKVEEKWRSEQRWGKRRGER